MTKEFDPVGTKTNADADVAAAGATTGTSQADVASAYRSAGAEVMSDIGQAEAYTVNMKRLVASELDHDQFIRANRERLIRNGEDDDQTLRNQGARSIEQSLQLQAKLNDQYLAYVAGLQATSISERERTVRVGDVANENMWSGNAAFDAIVETTVAKVLSKLGKA
jgi:hypothetical protein